MVHTEREELSHLCESINFSTKGLPLSVQVCIENEVVTGVDIQSQLFTLSLRFL